MKKIGLDTVSKDASALAEQISSRLKGRHFDEPAVILHGELPVEYLFRLHAKRYQKNKTIWQTAIRALLDDIYTRIIEVSRNRSTTWDKEFYWIPTLFELILETDVPEGEIASQISIVLLNSKSKLAFESLYYSLRILLKTVDGNNRTLQTIKVLVLSNPETAFQSAIILSQSHPGQLLKHQHLYLFIDSYVIEKKKWEDFTEVVRFCVLSIVHKKHNILNSGISYLKKVVAYYAKDAVGIQVKSHIIKGLSLAGISFKYVRLIEEEYWDRIDPVDVLTSPRYNMERDYLKKEYLGRHLTQALRHEGSLRINGLPYGEAAYLRVFQILIAIYYGNTVEWVPMSFNQVGQGIEQGKIDIAVHNASVEPHFNGSGNLMRGSNPIFLFNNYDLIASNKRLIKIANRKSLNPKVREAINSILEGQGGDAISNNKDGLFKLIEMAGISYMKGTDTEDCFNLFAGKKLNKTLESFSRNSLLDFGPDEGVERLIDGEVGFYIGGALQSHYARISFEDHVTLLTREPCKLEEYLYISKEKYTSNPEFFDQLLNLWNYVKDVWIFLKNPKSSPKPLTQFIKDLRLDLISTINRDRNIPNGYTSSFKDLNELLMKHDVLNEIPKEQFHFTEVRRSHKDGKLSVSYIREEKNGTNDY